MHPFIAAELGDAWSTEAALQTGLVPLVHQAADPADTVRAYVGLYLHQEVQHEGLVRDIGGFGRFLEALAFSHGAPLNLAAVSRDCEIARKTVDGYLSIIEDLLVAFRIPVFARAARRELSQHHKFFYFDTGVFRTLRPKGALDRPGHIEGAALEGLVAQHLRAWLAYSGRDAHLYHWRTAAGVEVDFVLYGEQVFAAIEVKSTNRLRREDLAGLEAFGRDYPMAQRWLVYRGNETAVERGVQVVPLEAFLHGGLAALQAVGGAAN